MMLDLLARWCFRGTVVFGALGLLLLSVAAIERPTSQVSNSPGTTLRCEHHPVCAHAEPRTLTEKQPSIKLDISPYCWSEWITTPITTDYRIDPPPDGWAEVRFLDGTTFRLEPGKPIDLGVRRGIFRLCGTGGVTVSAR